MRIVLMPSSYAPHLGGVEQVAGHLAAGLVCAGHDPLVIANRWPRTLPERARVDGVTVRRVPLRVPHRSVRGLGGYALHARGARRAVVDMAREHGCELVNLHCVSSNARYALEVANALDVALVVSLHGELSGDANQVYANDPALRRRWIRLLDRADLVTAPSQHTLAEAEAFRGRSLRRTQVIRNGVDLDLFAGGRAPDPQPVVFAAGRLVPNKGFDLLVEAWQDLPPDLAHVRLEIAGEGWGADALRRQIAASPVGERIVLTGRLDRPELARRMRSASAFVLPSRAEASGLVVLEAMAAGAPVLAADVGGVAEIVADGRTGLLFSTGSVSSLVARLTDLLRDPAAAGVRGQTAAQFVTALDWSACVAAHIAAYADAMRRPR